MCPCRDATAAEKKHTFGTARQRNEEIRSARGVESLIQRRQKSIRYSWLLDDAVWVLPVVKACFLFLAPVSPPPTHTFPLSFF